jgi:hypothetical protein
MDNPDLEAAQQLTSRIRALAVRDDHRGLLEIDAAPDTARLLDGLGTDLAAAARVHLDAARRWKSQMEAANRRRLEEARDALNGFDLALTRALLSRVEEDWLTPGDAAERDDVLLQMEARTMETEELTTLAARALEENRPRRRRWQRKRNS